MLKDNQAGDRSKHKYGGFLLRIIFYFFGLLIMSFGISLAIMARIGVPPASTPAIVASMLTPLSIGMCAALFYIFFIALQIAMTRRATIQHALQMPVSYAFGWLIDFYLYFFPIVPSGFVYSVVVLVCGTLLLALGICCVLKTNMVMMPPDALTRTVGDKLGWPMSKAKLAFDITLVVISTVATFIFLGINYIPVVVGVGTVIFASLAGPSIRFFQKLLPFLDIQKP
jgi:uncharacterized membrane protein YczE